MIGKHCGQRLARISPQGVSKIWWRCLICNRWFTQRTRRAKS